MNPHIPTEGWGTNQRAAVDGDAYFRLSEEWIMTRFNLTVHDLDDESKWGQPIKDPEEYVRRALS
jgi:hypothetical protein